MKEGRGFGDRYILSVPTIYKAKKQTIPQPLIVLELTDQMNKRYPITHLRILI